MSSLDPPLSETRAPRLETFDWQWLERLTETLLAYEPGVLTASQFGTSGQAQFGIDTKAELADGGCDVASCKKCDEIGKNDLAKWSSDFLDHWDTRWKAKGVRRFILVTTASIAPTQVAEAADKERERFKAIGVGYELWGQPQLIEKMRPHRGIVAEKVGTDWVDRICGPQQREALQAGNVPVGIADVGATQIAELRASLSGEAEARVTRGLEDLRAGDLGAVEKTIADLRKEPLWSQIEAGAQAKVLRFAASAALQRDDVDAARALCEQAEALSPAAEPRIAARIAFARDGAPAGLAVLGTPISRDGRQLQTAFFLTAGDLDRAEEILAELDREEPDPETTRLRAWTLLIRNQRKDALALVLQLEADVGRWLATSRTAAIARYAVALSPALGPEWFLNASPVDLDMVREDDEGRALLARATDDLDAVVKRTGDVEDRRWLLAVLACQRDRREEAQALAAALVAENPADHTAVAWTLSRRYEIDLAPSRSHFIGRYERGEADRVDVRILALLLAGNGDHAGARATIAAGLGAQSGEARDEAETWVARFTAEIGDGEPQADVPATDTLIDDIQRARASGDWSVVELGFAALADQPTPPLQTLAIAQLLAGASQWTILGRHRDAILAFATAEAVRILAYVVAHLESGEALVEFLEEHRSAFRNGEIPPDVRRLVVDGQRRSGDLVAALAEARALRAQTGDTRSRQLEAEVLATMGDTSGAASIVRDLLRSQDLDPAAALSWGETLRALDVELARDLWRYAVQSDPDPQLSVGAFFQAFSLGLEQEARPLWTHVARAAGEGSQGVRAMDVADMPEMMRALGDDAERIGALYLEGRVPVHFYAEQQKVGLDALLLPATGPGRGPLPLRLLRNGARPRHIKFDLPWSQWRLHLDVTALLVAADLGLLEAVERHPNPVVISAAVPTALIDMQRRASPHQPSRLALLREIETAFGNGLTVRSRHAGDLVVDLLDAEHGGFLDLDPVQLLEAAAAAGVLDADALAQGKAALSAAEGVLPEAVAALAPGSGIWLAGFAAEQLARSGQLGTILLAYDVGIDPEAAGGLLAYVESESAKADRAAWLDALRLRVLRAVEEGRFKFAVRTAEGAADLEEMEPMSAATVSLMDLLHLDDGMGAVTWFEDRNLTGYPSNRNHVIVEALDVIGAMADEGILSAAEARSTTVRMLGAGAGFVQIEADDVVPALRAAPIVEGRLRETPALASIRRDRAAARLLDQRLKVGPSTEKDDHRPDEAQALTSDMRLAHQCLERIWFDGSQTVEECIIRSDWIWRALRCERTLRDIPEDKPGDAARALATLCLASAGDALSMPIGIQGRLAVQRRKAFADWFWRAALGPHMIGDSNIIDRIADHFEGLYLPRLTGADPTATRAHEERRLIKIRIAALPRPVVEAIARKERFGDHLGTRTIEVINVRRSQFESARFWRAVRSARRYGKARLRTTKGERCIMLRTEGGIVVRGAVKARMTGPACEIFDVGVDILEGIARAIDGLDLGPDDRAELLDQARRARTPVQFNRVLVEARKRSVPAIYETMRQAFQSRRVSGEQFVPPPARSLMSHLRLAPGEEPFQDRLAQAARTLAREVGPEEALRRLGGLPISNLPALAGSETTEVVRASMANAVTPIKAFHWAQAELSAGHPDLRECGSEAIRRIDEGAKPLIAILAWTVHVLWQDADYRALDPADRLALAWCHADAVLEIFLRRGSAPDSVARYFGETQFAEPLSTAIDPERFLDNDASSPATLTPDVLIFHALGALFGERPVEKFLHPEDEQRLRTAFTVGEGDQRSPAPALTLRNFQGRNELGSFLTEAPATVAALAHDPAAMRAGVVGGAIQKLGDHPDDAMSWAYLAQHARTGLSLEETAKAQELLDALDLESFSLGARDALPVPRMVAKAMGWVLPREKRVRILEVVRATARNAASSGLDPMPKRATEVSGTLDPVHEVLEICASYAGVEAEDMFERFEAAVVTAAEEWPAALPAFRELVDDVARSNSVIDAPALWRLHLTLNAYP